MLPFCTNQQQSTWEYGLLLQRLLQLRVLRLGFFQNGDVRVGVLPEGEKVLVDAFRFGAISLHGISSTQLPVCQSAYGIAGHDPAVIKNLLEFGGGFGSLV